MTGMDTSKAKPGQYTCPMDPEVISDTPGKCPKCGMPLELVPATAEMSGHSGSEMETSPAKPVPGW